MRIFNHAFVALTLGCLNLIGCASSRQSTQPQLFFREVLSTQGGTWAAFELVNPSTHPIWIEGFGPADPLERWEQMLADGTWVAAPGPISATGSEPELVPPGTSVWIKKRVDDFASEESVLRLGVRNIREDAGNFSDGKDILWSTPVRLPTTRKAH